MDRDLNCDLDDFSEHPRSRHVRSLGGEIWWLKMERAASPSRLPPEFDDFLFASIGEDQAGCCSAWSRRWQELDVDPWQEAAKLARLPVEAATQRLASLIAALPEAQRPRWDPMTIARRLIGLLPRPANFPAPTPKSLPGIDIAQKSPALVYVLLVVFVLSAQLFAASHQPPAQVGDGNPPSSTTLSPNTQAAPAQR